MSNLYKLKQVVVCAALVALTVVVTARYAMAQADSARFRPALRNAPGERRLTPEQLELIAQRLRDTHRLAGARL